MLAGTHHENANSKLRSKRAPASLDSQGHSRRRQNEAIRLGRFDLVVPRIDTEVGPYPPSHDIGKRIDAWHGRILTVSL